MKSKLRIEGLNRMISFKDKIMSRIEFISRMIGQLEMKVKSYPDGSIYLRHVREHVYFYRLVNGVEIRLTDKDEIGNYMQKKYLKSVLLSLNREKKALMDALDHYPTVVAEDRYDTLNPDRKKWVKPIIPTDEQFVTEWQNRPYTPKPFKKGTPYFETLRGERVRSKSEVIIADRLYTSGIPYKYECPLIVGNEVFHPDFTILRVSDRKILYLEHNGKVGDEEYGDDMVDRINKYSLAGILQNDKLYFTFESANRPLDVRTLDKMINEVFR